MIRSTLSFVFAYFIMFQCFANGTIKIFNKLASCKMECVNRVFKKWHLDMYVFTEVCTSHAAIERLLEKTCLNT